MTADELAKRLRMKCAPDIVAFGAPSPRERKRRGEASDRVARKMHAVMSRNPNMPKDQAVKSTVGNLTFVLQFIFPQYALLIKLAAMAWELLSGNQS